MNEPTLRPYDPTAYERLRYLLGGYGQQRPSLDRQRLVEGLLALVPGLRMQEAARAGQAGRIGEAAQNVAASLPVVMPAARLPAAGAGALAARAGTMPAATSTALSPFGMVRNQQYLPPGMRTVGGSYATNSAGPFVSSFRTNFPVGSASGSLLP